MDGWMDACLVDVSMDARMEISVSIRLMTCAVDARTLFWQKRRRREPKKRKSGEKTDAEREGEGEREERERERDAVSSNCG